MKKLIFLVIPIFLIVSLTFAMTDVQKKKGKVVIIKTDNDEQHFGLVVAKPDRKTLEKYGLQGGAEILKVYENSAAEKAGLKEHDIIIKFDGERIEDPDDLEDYFDELEEEKDVDIVVNRSGKELIFTAHVRPLNLEDQEIVLRLKAAKLRARADSIVKHLKKNLKNLPVANLKGGYLGVEAETLSKQLADYFGVEFGVLVEEVIKDSPAKKAALKPVM